MTTGRPETDLTTIDRGSITAPAGFGKTHVIAATVAAHPRRRFLILTHTNAGVRALRTRIRQTAPAHSARIETIAGLALRLSRAFPTGIGWAEEAKIDHCQALIGANAILQRTTVLHALVSSYDQMIVDEYQDCTIAQHTMITRIADAVPTAILGDPLQAIFQLSSTDPLISWAEAETSFPPCNHLTTPHRWANTNPDLGLWLKAIRKPLQANEPIPLPSPRVLTQYRMPRMVYEGGLYGAVKPQGSQAILIPDSARFNEIPPLGRAFAKRRAAVHEAVELPDLVALGGKLAERTHSAEHLLLVIDYVAETTTQVKKSQVNTLIRRLAKDGIAGSGTHPVYATARAYIDTPHGPALTAFVRALIAMPNSATHRPTLLHTFLEALHALGTQPLTEVPDAIRRTIDARRHTSPPTNGITIGSTLRVKGLEYDHVILNDPARVPSAEHLYVALSRARRHITLAIPPDATTGQWFTTS